MLIAFPVDYSLHTNRFPWAITMLSILICLVYFTCQINDQYNEEKTKQYYFQSKLYQLELPGYVDYLSRKSDESILSPNISKLDLYWLSRGDKEFQQLLSASEIVTTANPFYWEWYTRHRYYQYLLTLDATNYAGFKSAQPSLSDAFTSIFLHGGFLHLLGNVLFLIFIGRYVEACIGGIGTFFIFIGLGMGSVGIYSLLTFPTLYPLVGASGAIAGLMGMFAILFQSKKLPFFVNIFFFSGILRFKAIILLPVWISWEWMQNFWLNTEEVAYTAHIGGIFLGALAGIIVTRFFPELRPEKENSKYSLFQKEYEQAMCELTNLNFPKAKQILMKLHEAFPAENSVLYKLFFILKLEPKSEEYKKIVSEILQLNLYHPDELAIQKQVKKHYTGIS